MTSKDKNAIRDFIWETDRQKVIECVNRINRIIQRQSKGEEGE